MKRRTHWILWPSLTLLTLGAYRAYRVRTRPEETLFTVEAVRRQDLRDTLSGGGEIQVRTRMNVGTPVPGEIQQVHVREGQWVRAGDPLVTLAPGRFGAQLGQQGGTPTLVRAPIGGRVLGLQAERGEMALVGHPSQAGALLMAIADMGKLLADMKVGELDLPRLKEGAVAEVQVEALRNRVFQGKVLSVGAVAERRNPGFGGGQEGQSYRVRVQLKGTPQELGALTPGMSCRVVILAAEVKDVLAVPLPALLEREDRRQEGYGLIHPNRSVVFAYREGKVVEQPLKLGLVTRRAAQVLEGLKPGDQVVTGPSKALLQLSSGRTIKVKGQG